MRLTEAEWPVMEILWSGDNFSLGEITKALEETKGWSKNTVHTYLARMNTKGLVNIKKGDPRPYSAAVSRDACARQERNELLTKVYGGAAGDLIAAFLKDSTISRKEVDKLKKLLDEMEV